MYSGVSLLFYAFLVCVLRCHYVLVYVTCELLCGYRSLVVCTIMLLLWVQVTMDAADITFQFIWLCACLSPLM
jgi:hypothetical protein